MLTEAEEAQIEAVREVTGGRTLSLYNYTGACSKTSPGPTVALGQFGCEPPCSENIFLLHVSLPRLEHNFCFMVYIHMV